MTEPAVADVLGTPIFVGDVASGASWVVERALAGAGGYVCLCNVHLFVVARHDDEVRRALAGAALAFPDGWPIAWLQRRLGNRSATRVAGPDLMARVIADVRRASPHVVWLSLGCPKQELWMLRYAHELAPALVAGVGAAFDFHAETKKRAPAWAQRAGLEWLHRLLSEPRRLASRYARTNSEFLLLAGRELLRQRRS